MLVREKWILPLEIHCTITTAMKNQPRLDLHWVQVIHWLDTSHQARLFYLGCNCIFLLWLGSHVQSPRCFDFVCLLLCLLPIFAPLGSVSHIFYKQKRLTRCLSYFHGIYETSTLLLHLRGMLEVIESQNTTFYKVTNRPIARSPFSSS